jgi:nicotinate-nucleotide adenylyltransferase
MVVAQPVRLGIYGGSFDPIHFGHLAIAEEARSALGLAAVAFVPAARQPLKGHAQTAPEHRLAMVRLACADNPAFYADDLELRRPPPSFTFDTLAAFRQRHPPPVELWFILGADAARDLPRWRRATEVIAIASLAIVGRPGHTIDLPVLAAALPGLADRHALIDGPRLAISSTNLRRRLAEGRPVRYQIPDVVLSYIAAQNLYQPL